MRTILFRGKNQDNGKWVEGSLIHMTKTSYCFEKEEDIPQIERENNMFKIVWTLTTDWGLPNKHFMTGVIPDTVSQYVGLRDDCGQNVFEGDILNFENMGKIVIKWDENILQFVYQFIDNIALGGVISELKQHTIHIIGNIWEKKYENLF